MPVPSNVKLAVEVYVSILVVFTILIERKLLTTSHDSCQVWFRYWVACWAELGESSHVPLYVKKGLASSTKATVSREASEFDYIEHTRDVVDRHDDSCLCHCFGDLNRSRNAQRASENLFAGKR
jgi:hypothetical protein